MGVGRGISRVRPLDRRGRLDHQRIEGRYAAAGYIIDQMFVAAGIHRTEDKDGPASTLLIHDIERIQPRRLGDDCKVTGLSVGLPMFSNTTFEVSVRLVPE